MQRNPICFPSPAGDCSSVSILPFKGQRVCRYSWKAAQTSIRSGGWLRRKCRVTFETLGTAPWSLLRCRGTRSIVEQVWQTGAEIQAEKGTRQKKEPSRAGAKGQLVRCSKGIGVHLPGIASCLRERQVPELSQAMLGWDRITHEGEHPGLAVRATPEPTRVYRVRGLLYAISQHSKATAPRRPEKANRLLKANQHFNSTHQDSHSLQRTARSAQTNKSMDDKDVNLNAALGTVSSLLKFSDPFIASTSFFRTNLKQFS